METQTQNNSLTTVSTDVIKTLNETVISVISSTGMQGFEKAFLIAEATGKLKAALTPEYMKPIMQLQGSKLGFKTDKDEEGGYLMEVVRNCLIEAVLTGVQPFGNQFNIIAGNCYITKEGFGYMLPKFPGLDYEIIPQLPRINNERTSAAIVMEIVWTLNGVREERKIDFPIRMNKFMGTDAVIGKATRKARAWLFSKLTGIEIGDGDVNDIDHKVVDTKKIAKTSQESEHERVSLLIDDAKTLTELEAISKHVPDSLLDKYTVKQDELKAQSNPQR